MRKYAVVYDFSKEKEAGLVRRLEIDGFVVGKGFRNVEVSHKSMPDTSIGYIDLFGVNVYLYVLTVEGNPLEQFVVKYESLRERPLASSQYSRTKK